MATFDNSIAAKQSLLAASNSERDIGLLYLALCGRSINLSLWDELWAEYIAHSGIAEHLWHAWLRHCATDRGA